MTCLPALLKSNRLHFMLHCPMGSLYILQITIVLQFCCVLLLKDCQAVIRQSSGSHQAINRPSSSRHQAVIRQSSGSHRRAIIIIEQPRLFSLVYKCSTMRLCKFFDEIFLAFLLINRGQKVHSGAPEFFFLSKPTVFFYSNFLKKKNLVNIPTVWTIERFQLGVLQGSTVYVACSSVHYYSALHQNLPARRMPRQTVAQCTTTIHYT